jgi:predicted nucleotidyltransferase
MKSKKVDRTVHKSGLFRKELLLLRPFIREPWKEFTMTQIKEMTKNRSHHYVYDALEKFISYGILSKDMKGNTNIFQLNRQNHQNVHYLTLTEYLVKDEISDPPLGDIYRLMEKIKSPFYSLIVCGSYAEGKQKPDSDLDVAIIIPDYESKRPYEIALKEGELMMPEIHGFVFTAEEFYLMLTNKEFNYGKELARKHVIIYGAEAYYKILFRAMENGFNG